MPYANIRKKLNFSIVISMVFLTLELTSCQESPAIDPPKQSTNKLRELLSEVVTDNGIPGIIAAIIDGDSIRVMESAGIRKIGSPDSLTTGDLIHLGSCTKAMTSTLLATLVKNSELTWETTIIEIFPELKDAIHADYHHITLHQLVTHRAGVPANASDWWSHQNLSIKERRLEIIKDNLSYPTQVNANEFLYSNLGYMIAGAMAEKVTDRTWEELIDERLFTPLCMNSAGFGVPGTPDKTDQPWGHSKSGGSWNPLQADNAVALGPAGRVHCTFEDWAKFIRLQLPKHHPKILNREHLDALTVPVGDYAAGWGVGSRSWANGITLSHSGSNTMWYVIVWVAPEINRAFMVGTNSFNNQTFGIADRVIGELIELDKESEED